MAKGYNKYQYETSPRKLEPYYTPNKKTNNKQKAETNRNKNIKKKREQEKLKLKVMMYVVIAFTILFAISYRNAKIDEKFDNVQTLKAELASVEKENAQLEVAIESSLNLTNLEHQARNLLGMQKLTNRQTEYVSLPKTDYIERAAEQIVLEEKVGIIETVRNYIVQLFK